jgi:hypothetical protein
VPTAASGPSASRVTAARSTGPGVAVSATPRVQGPAIVDRLDRPGQWKRRPPADNGDGSCTFDGRMAATTHLASSYACPGPADLFAGDQTISVDATVVTANACAVIWFRVVGENGYQASFCPAEVRLGQSDEHGNVNGVRTVRSAAFQPGRTHRVDIAVRGGTAQVAIDSAPVLSMPLTDPQLAAGRVQLGVYNDLRSGDATATFANAELRSPVVGRPLSFPDLLGPDRTSAVVQVHSYDPSAHVVVAEPVLLLSPPEYCKLFKIKPSDDRCKAETETPVTVESHLKVTVPVSSHPTLTTAEDPSGEGNCTGTQTGGGTCRTTAAGFAAWLQHNPAGQVAVTARNGTVDKLAEIYQS